MFNRFDIDGGKVTKTLHLSRT